MKITILSSVLSAALLLSSPLLAKQNSALIEKLNESFYSDSSAAAKMKALQNYLKKGGDINAIDAEGSSLLSMWLFAGLDTKDAVKMLNYMVEKGIDINYQRKYPAGYGGDNLGEGGTVLMRACTSSDESSDVDGGGANPAIVKAILDAGADVDLKDENGYDALGYALGSGNPEIVKILIDAGADPKHRDEEGRTSLMNIAAGYEPDSAMIPILLEAGVRINARDDEGKSVLSIFCESFPEYDGRDAFIETLLEAGADPKLKDNEGKSAIDQLKAHLPGSKKIMEKMR